MSEYTEMTEEEIEQLRELIDLQTEQIRLGKKSNEQAIRDYLEKTKTGKALSGVGKAAKGVTDGFVKSASAMASSTGDFGALSGAVGGTVKAVTGLMSAMTNIAGEIPFVGGALDAMGDAAIGVASFAFSEVQKGFDTFQELSKAGQIGADGIEGMAKQMRATNMPLATYSKLLKQNSEDLGFLSVSALDGGKIFSKTMVDMAGETGKPLRRLGLSIEEIGETVVDFQVMQRRNGILDQLSQAQITKGTAEYAKELDLIAKLTGKSREGIQKEREEQMSDSRFRAAIAEMGVKEQEAHKSALNQITDPTLRRAYMDQLTGFTNSAASIQMEIVGMGQSIRDAQASIAAGGDSTEAVNGLKEMALEVTKTGGVFQQYSKVMESGQGVMGDFAALSDFAVNTLKDQKDVTTAQTTQMEKLGTQADKLSGAMMDMQKVTSVMNNVFLESKAASIAVSKFASMTSDITTYVEETLLGKSPADKLTDDLANLALDTSINTLESITGVDRRVGQALGGILWDIFGDKPEAQPTMSGEDMRENDAYFARGGVPMPDPNSIRSKRAKLQKKPVPAQAANVSGPETAPVENVNYAAKIRELQGAKAIASNEMINFESQARKSDGINSTEKAELVKIANGIVAMNKELRELRELSRRQNSTLEKGNQIAKQAN